MKLVDWRELYASNQAAIERAGGMRTELPTALQAPSSPRLPRLTAPQSATLAEPRLRFVVHVPRGADRETAVPLVCMLHGCTQDAAGFAAATRMNEAADRHGFVVVYPEQDRGQNPQGCWNWFLPEHQARGTGEPAAIVATLRHVMDTTSTATIDRRRVFVAGLSAGGAMAMVLAATYPDLFAAVGVHSGLAYRSAGNVATAFGAMARGGGGPAELGAAIPSIVIHGTADQTVAPLNADHVLSQSMAADGRGAPQTPTTSRGQIDGGHSYTRTRWTDSRGTLRHELLKIEGLAHAWSGGAPGHPHSDPSGPNASEAIWRFFEQATPVSESPAAASGDATGSRPHRGALPPATR